MFTCFWRFSVWFLRVSQRTGARDLAQDQIGKLQRDMQKKQAENVKTLDALRTKNEELLG